MSLPDVTVGVLWIGVTLYAVLGGADFGAGFWDLLAGGPRQGAESRSLIARSIGPLWEANHVWLIFGLVILWTGFPRAFVSVMTTLNVPLAAAALGIVLRGAGFVLRKPMGSVTAQRTFGATFAISSIVTPFFLGTVAGGVASGRVPLGDAAGDPVTSWLNPTSLLGGILAVLSCAYLAGTYLVADARREGREALAEAFRRRAMVLGVVTGAVAVAGIALLALDAPALFSGLRTRALPLVVLSAVAGLVSLHATARRHPARARVAAAAAVAAIIWGWGVAQHPDLLPGSVTVAEAAAHPAALRAVLLSVAAGTVLLAPALWLLFSLFKGPRAGGS